MLLLAAIAFAVAADGGMDVPPPGPVPAALATSFAAVIAKNTAFAATQGRTVSPDPKYGRRSLCGDAAGHVCAVAAAMVPVAGGACPRACQAEQ